MQSISKCNPTDRAHVLRCSCALFSCFSWKNCQACPTSILEVVGGGMCHIVSRSIAHAGLVLEIPMPTASTAGLLCSCRNEVAAMFFDKLTMVRLLRAGIDAGAGTMLMRQTLSRLAVVSLMLLLRKSWLH